MKTRKQPKRTKRPLTIFFDPQLVAALDEWREKLGPSPRWTRVDLIRVVLARAVRERGAKGAQP